MWVVFNLTPQGEEEDPEVLTKTFRKYFPNSEVFIPAAISHVGGNRVVTKLIDNYVFVRAGLPDQAYKKVEGTRYILNALMKPGRKGFETVRDADIEKMQRQLDTLTNQDIQVGDHVEILSGPYRQMVVRVFEEIPEEGKVAVLVSLRSKSQILTLPRDFLRIVKKGERDDDKVGTSLTPYINRLTKTSAWVGRARVFLKTLPRFERVQGTVFLWGLVHRFQREMKGFEDLLELPRDRDLSTPRAQLQAYLDYIARAPDFFYLQQSSDLLTSLSRATVLKSNLAKFKDWNKRLQRIEGKVRELDNTLSTRQA